MANEARNVSPCFRYYTILCYYIGWCLGHIISTIHVAERWSPIWMWHGAWCAIRQRHAWQRMSHLNKRCVLCRYWHGIADKNFWIQSIHTRFHMHVVVVIFSYSVFAIAVLFFSSAFRLYCVATCVYRVRAAELDLCWINRHNESWEYLIIWRRT